MSGILNNAPAPPTPTPPASDTATPGPAAPGDFTMSDPVLSAAEKQIEANLQADPSNQQNYMKIVVAGMHAGLTGGPQSILASLQHSKDPVSDAARGAVSLVLILRKEARGVMPIKAMVPAGMTLMLYALDFINRSGLAKVGAPELDRAAQIYSNEMFRDLHISPAMLQNATARVHAITQDPAAMEKINLKAGITRHPMAATPTPLPPTSAPEG